MQEILSSQAGPGQGSTNLLPEITETHTSHGNFPWEFTHKKANKFICHRKSVSATETSHRKEFLQQKQVTERSICDIRKKKEENFCSVSVAENFSESGFCYRNTFMWLVFVSETLFWQKFCDKFLVVTKYAFVWLFMHEFSGKVSVRSGSFRYPR